MIDSESSITLFIVLVMASEQWQHPEIRKYGSI
jgi:hypothetical protein